MLPDHAEQAVQEQAQCEAVRARRSSAAGGSSVDPDTTAQVDCGTFLAALAERLFRLPALSHEQHFLLLGLADGCFPSACISKVGSAYKCKICNI